MKQSALVLALAALSGCGGSVTPELYKLSVAAFALPDSCYENNQQPAQTYPILPPNLITVEVWDAPEGAAYLEIIDGDLNVGMGAAPAVAVTGVFTGKKSDKGFTFARDVTARQTYGETTSVTTTTHVELTFPRGGPTFAGTGAINSSSNCAGTICPGTNPSCAVTSIGFNGTRIAVDYEKSP